VQKGIAKEPRIAAMRGIMLARSKPVKLVEPVAVDPLTQVLEFEKPVPRAACKFIDADSPAQLLDLLQNEAKVI
jgi:electron transfer flavoprotein beta subunit